MKNQQNINEKNNEFIKCNFLRENPDFHLITELPKVHQNVIVAILDEEHEIIFKVINTEKFKSFHDLYRVIGWKYAYH